MLPGKGGGDMTPPVSTSCGDWLCGLPGECGGGAGRGGVVGDAVEPAAPYDADPGAGEDADGVGVVLAAGAGVAVNLGGPGAGVPAVVGEGGDRDPEALVAGPAEVDAAVLAGFLGDRGDSGEGSDGVGPGVGLAAV